MSAGPHESSLHVTGATGFLGRELVRLRPDATTERVDVRDARAVSRLLRRLRPEVVIHTAYRQHGDGARETTVDGSANVARAARGVGTRLVRLSTDAVFDGAKGSPYVGTLDSSLARALLRGRLRGVREVLGGEVSPAA